MEAFEIRKGSDGPARLHAVKRPEPEPGPGQILVRMRAASLNYRDQLILAGSYLTPLTGDFVPLSDGAGEVIANGPDVHRFKVGDRIVGTFFRGWLDGKPPGQLPELGAPPVDGVLAEYVVFDQEDAVLIPAGLSFEQAATLPCAGVTAWHALVLACGVWSEDSVLILGSGGVSLFALQFARAKAAKVIMTSSSDEKIARAKLLYEAVVGINYCRSPEWEHEVLELTAGHGVDHVIEVGGPGTLARSMRSVAPCGHIALIGVLAGRGGDTNPRQLMLKNASLHGIHVGSRAMFESMLAAIEANQIRPVIDRVFPMEAVTEAYRYQRTGAFGKVVISF